MRGLLAPDCERHVVGNELSLRHGRASVRVPDAGLGNIATGIDVLQGASVDLKCRLDEDVARLRDGFRGDAAQQFR